MESVVGSGILKKEDGFSDLRRRRMSLATSPDDAGDDMLALMQRRVSFNHIHNVRLFQVIQLKYIIKKAGLFLVSSCVAKTGCRWGAEAV